MEDHEIAARDLRALIEAKGVKMDCVPVLESPHMDREWQKKAKAASVQCRVSAPSLKAPFIVHYSAGVGVWLPEVEKASGFMRGEIKTAKENAGKRGAWHDYTCSEGLFERARKAWKPDVFNVISSCLDAAPEIGATFGEWANEYGYDADSRKAEQTFQECQRVGKEMRALFGADFARARDLAIQL